MERLMHENFIEPSDKKTIEEDLVVHSRNKKNDKLVIFIHGLRGSRYGKNSTWGKFPKYLFEDLNEFDIGLYQYATLEKRLFKTSLTMEQEAQSFSNMLRDELSKYKNIIFIAHSMGGILAKSVITQLISDNNISTLSKISGLFLMATPNIGAKWVPPFISSFSSDFRVLKSHNNFLTTVNKTLENYFIFGDDTYSYVKKNLPTWAVVASSDFWVSELSAGICLSSERKRFVKGSHTSIVKPKSKKTDATYKWIKEKILLCCKQYKYDVFIASTMAGHENNDNYKKAKKEIDEIKKHLIENCNIKTVYYAGDTLETKNDFSPQSLSLELDMKALKESKYFLLYYPEKIMSSVLFEAGFALALGKPSVYLVKNRADLPYLMEQAGQANVQSQINTYTFTDTNNLLNLLDKHCTNLWK